MTAADGAAAKDSGGTTRRLSYAIAKEPAVNSPRRRFDNPRDEDQRGQEQKSLALAAILIWALIFALGGIWLA